VPFSKMGSGPTTPLINLVEVIFISKSYQRWPPIATIKFRLSFSTNTKGRFNHVPRNV
jgi:hypothetical protein